ncbi:MAG: DUF167 domain-containing protein [Longimicrobiales bacterium]
MTADAATVRLRVRVQPRASRTELAGEHDGALKVRLAASPVGGDANRELVRFVAKTLGVAPSRVRLVSGATSRSKTLEITGVDAEAVRVAFGL